MEDSHFIEIQRLCQLAHERGLREIALSREGFSVSLTAVEPDTVLLTHAPAQPQPTAATEPAVPSGYAITSPLVGLFYRSPSPDAPPFVEIGDEVEVGQTIGIVEAMKVFNEITSDKAGQVIAFPTENGALVQADQPLVILAPQE